MNFIRLFVGLFLLLNVSVISANFEQILTEAQRARAQGNYDSFLAHLPVELRNELQRFYTNVSSISFEIQNNTDDTFIVTASNHNYTLKPHQKSNFPFDFKSVTGASEGKEKAEFILSAAGKNETAKNILPGKYTFSVERNISKGSPRTYLELRNKYTLHAILARAVNHLLVAGKDIPIIENNIQGPWASAKTDKFSIKLILQGNDLKESRIEIIPIQ